MAFLTVLLFHLVTSIQANTVDSLRQILPQLNGEKRLEALQEIYRSCVATGDYELQLHSLDDFIAELDKQDKQSMLARALVDRVVLFYNYDQNDSIFKYVPLYLKRLRAM